VNHGGNDSMDKLPEEPRARRRDVMDLLAANRPASLEAPPRGAASARAAAIAAARSTDNRRENRGPRARPVIKRTMMTVGVAFTAAGAAVAVLVSAVHGTPRPAATGAATVPATSRAHARTAQPTTARQVLLAAAANVPSAPLTGRYWHFRAMRGLTFPAGTPAHPYDISLAQSLEEWDPSVAGQKAWGISQQLGVVPATPADGVAWRAAGSPTTWSSGKWPPTMNDTRGAIFWARPLTATTTAAPPLVAWGKSDGTVGVVEGNTTFLNAAQFRQIPPSPRALTAFLRQVYDQTGCSHETGCSPVDQFIWTMSVNLLQDPVSPEVKSAAFKVMASLPGVRLLGAMTDPLGRHGFGLAVTDDLLGTAHPDPRIHLTQAAVIDPATGTLLAVEDVGPMPRNVACMTYDSAGRCVGPSYTGRSYPGQVDAYAAIVSEGWTDTTPTLPANATRYGPVFPVTPWIEPLPGNNTGGLPLDSPANRAP
jgi:hypothetical protein